ncbi:MAG: ABC transporter permease [Ilumatobacteraceae bacterium]
MGGWIARRLLSMIAVLLVLTFLVFVIQSVLPADPVRAFFGRNSPPAEIAARRAELGYDQPFVMQYVDFLGRAVRGDLGDSLRTRRPVTDDLADFLPATLELAATAAVFAGVFGIALGLTGALRHAGSGVVRVVAIVLSAAPTFLLALLGILLFYRRLGWLPAGGRAADPNAPIVTNFLVLDGILRLDPSQSWDALRHLLLPAAVLAIGPAVAIGRTLRATLSTVMLDDHVRTAEAKGLGRRRIVLRHALRNAIGPVLSIAGLQLGLLLAGAVVVEVIFSWPGVGLYLYQGIAQSDFPAVVGVVLVLGVIYVVLNAVVDLLQVWADPRLRVAT